MRTTSLGLALAFGILAPAAALAATATRTEQVKAPAAVSALELKVENGDVKVVAGRAFAATVVIEVEADTQAGADFLLARSKVDLNAQGGRAELGLRQPSKDERAGNGKHEIRAKYHITLPATAALTASAVNAGIKVAGITGALALESVNGAIEATGAGRELSLSSVNGKVDGAIAEQFVALGKDARIRAETVNGPITLVLPAKARLRLEAGSLNGELVSTLPLPQQRQPAGPGPLNRRYDGKTEGEGDLPIVRCKSVNGRVAVLASGTTLANAQPLVVSAPVVPGLQKANVTEGGTRSRSHDDIKRGAVEGDFVVEGGASDVHVGNVNGAARVRTLAGDVRLGNVAKSATVESSGGDIRIDSVKGDVQARTGGGDVRVDDVAGNARLDTQGGDIEVGAVGGDVSAITAGGDVTLGRVHGNVRAETAGGDVSVEVVSKVLSGGVELTTSGGDVTLTVPANFRAEVSIETRLGDGFLPRTATRAITSDFDEIKPTQVGSVFTAKGRLGAGGPKVVIRSLGGTVQLKKGPGI